MPEVKSVKSSVTPDGTAILSRTIVAHDAFDALAAEAAVKVQDARLPSTAAFLGSGAVVGTGVAETKREALLRASPRAVRK